MGVGRVYMRAVIDREMERRGGRGGSVCGEEERQRWKCVWRGGEAGVEVCVERRGGRVEVCVERRGGRGGSVCGEEGKAGVWDMTSL